MFYKNFKSKINKILLSVFLIVFLFGLISDAWTSSPQFNICPGDLETLRLKNRTQGDTEWKDPVSANQCDQIGFAVYYHNCVSCTVAQNTRIRIDYPNVPATPIIATAYLWADNAPQVSDTGTINVSSAQKLIFDSTAKWYPNQGTVPTNIPVTDTGSSVEVNIGDIQGNWAYQGYVVFEATLSCNHPPVADAGPDKEVWEEESVILEGSGSDPDGDPIDYSWSCTGGSLSDPNIAQPVFYAPSVALDTSYTCTLTVTDNKGLSDSDSADVLVKDKSLSVVLEPIPSSGTAPLNDVDLKATVSGTATGDITYKFDCTNNGSWEATYTTSSTTYTAPDLCDYPSAGTYTAKVEATRGGLTAEDTADITVSTSPPPCDLCVDLTTIPSSGCLPLNDVDLKATVSGTATGLIDYKFDCENDGTWDLEIDNSGENPYTALDLCSYSAAGSYTTKAEVTRGGLTAEDTSLVQVSDCSCTYPTVDIKANDSDGPITIPQNTSATLSWASTDADSCSASGGWSGSKAVSGSESTGSLSSSRTFTITCINTCGSASDTVQVNVSGGSYNCMLPLSADIKANNSDEPITIAYETSATLSWTSANLSSCSASGDWSGSKALSGSESTGNLTSSKSYTLTCISPCGSVTDTIEVEVIPPALEIEKLVRNLSKGGSFLDLVSAEPDDLLSFQIEITATGGSFSGVIVEDSLPDEIIYQGNLKVDGIPTTGDIISGFNIGDLSSGQTKTITFNAKIADECEFSYGETQVINTVLAHKTVISISDTAEVIVSRKKVAGATDICTALTNNIFLDSFLLPLLIASLVIWLLRSQIIRFEEWLDSRKERYKEYRSKKNLQLKIGKIKAKEFFQRKII
jgi:hypothetical protein